jgi:hypothetical protein
MASLQNRFAAAHGSSDDTSANAHAAASPAKDGSSPAPESASAMVPSPSPSGAPSPSAPHDLVRSQLVICAVAAALIIAVIILARVLGGSSAPVSRQQVESKLDYLVGSSAVTAYNSLNGYPVMFMMPDDGNPLGTWTASDADRDASQSADADADSDAADSKSVRMVDVTYQVQVAANNDYALDDARYTVTGYSSPDEMTGQITVYVVERFRQYEEELSQTLSIDSVARALSEYGSELYGDGFELLSVETTSVEAESGTWLVNGYARIDGTSSQDGEVSGDAAWQSSSEQGDETSSSQTVEFSAQVSGTDESPLVESFNLIG